MALSAVILYGYERVAAALESVMSGQGRRATNNLSDLARVAVYAESHREATSQVTSDRAHRHDAPRNRTPHARAPSAHACLRPRSRPPNRARATYPTRPPLTPGAFPLSGDSVHITPVVPRSLTLHRVMPPQEL